MQNAQELQNKVPVVALCGPHGAGKSLIYMTLYACSGHEYIASPAKLARFNLSVNEHSGLTIVSQEKYANDRLAYRTWRHDYVYSNIALVETEYFRRHSTREEIEYGTTVYPRVCDIKSCNCILVDMPGRSRYKHALIKHLFIANALVIVVPAYDYLGTTLLKNHASNQQAPNNADAADKEFVSVANDFDKYEHLFKCNDEHWAQLRDILLISKARGITRAICAVTFTLGDIKKYAQCADKTIDSNAIEKIFNFKCQELKRLFVDETQFHASEQEFLGMSIVPVNLSTTEGIISSKACMSNLPESLFTPFYKNGKTLKQALMQECSTAPAYNQPTTIINNSNDITIGANNFMNKFAKAPEAQALNPNLPIFTTPSVMVTFLNDKIGGVGTVSRVMLVHGKLAVVPQTQLYVCPTMSVATVKSIESFLNPVDSVEAKQQYTGNSNQMLSTLYGINIKNVSCKDLKATYGLVFSNYPLKAARLLFAKVTVVKNYLQLSAATKTDVVKPKKIPVPSLKVGATYRVYYNAVRCTCKVVDICTNNGNEIVLNDNELHASQSATVKLEIQQNCMVMHEQVPQLSLFFIFDKGSLLAQCNLITVQEFYEQQAL